LEELNQWFLYNGISWDIKGIFWENIMGIIMIFEWDIMGNNGDL
jgi:hypothetical protein